MSAVSPPPLYLFEDSLVERLYPLTYARSPCELRAGMHTLLERMQANLPLPVAGLLVRSQLAPILHQRLAGLPINPPLSTRGGILLVNARLFLLRSTSLWSGQFPPPDSAGLDQGAVVWMHLSPANAARLELSRLHESQSFDAVLADVQRTSAAGLLIERPWQLLDCQRPAILEDFARLHEHKGKRTHGTSAALMPGAHLLAEQNIHLDEGVKIWPGAVLDAQNGPILIGKDTEIRAQAVLTGPLAIGPHCIIRSHADIREDCSFGPHSRAGGEIINSVFLGYANKQHEGFLGQSIIGEWVNLGAGTTTSNLKNTYGQVVMPLHGQDEPTGRTFLGSLIADHAKLGIGTCLSTGSVIGFASHVVAPRPPRFVPSFAWLTGERGKDGTDKKIERANFEKIEQIATAAMQRRGMPFTAADHELFVYVASLSAVAEKYEWGEPSP